MAATTKDLARIQGCIENRLDRRAIGQKKIAGIVGDAPSHYARSPAIWNAAFRAVGMQAIYLPFDTAPSKLPDLVGALKQCDRFMGVNVTVPYKLKIMDYLDEIDSEAKQIKAVNTVVRTAAGRLLGTNTDGKGFVDSVLTPQPGEESPFLESLRGIDVLMIGAGGSARAVAFQLAKVLKKGRLLISNRTPEGAHGLAQDIRKIFANVQEINEQDIPEYAPKVGLIINCSTKGQGGIRKTADGRATSLEPYSALAPAHPVAIRQTPQGEADFYREWLWASLADIEANNRLSLQTALSVPPHVGFCDLIYFPTETVFLRHGRLSGHRTLNGKGMNVAQAAEGFFHGICRAYLKKLGKHNSSTHKRIFEVMHEVW